ncbi:glycosyltransferase involved in cell wall biosynthesis [Amorphus suaedae]
MTGIAFAIPGDLDTATGGYAYDRRVIAGLRDMGRDVAIVGLGGGFPDPVAIDDEYVRRALGAIPDGTPTLIDGLALGILPAEAATLAARVPVVALVHHPLGLETGLDAERRGALLASERRALAACRHVIVTSHATARTLSAELDVAAARITVAEPGVDRPAAFRRAEAPTPTLLAVGALVRRKGYDVLVEALAQIRPLAWNAEIIGDPGRDPATAADLARAIAEAGLADRVRLRGQVDDAALAHAYRSAHLFVIASRYEGYGMVAAEALAYGLPIVSTDAGALADTVPADAALKVAPDDPAALADALRRVLEDRDLWQRLRAGAETASHSLPTWRDCAGTINQVLEDLRR